MRQYIQDGQLQAGAQLPTEDEFCRMFDVSRSTVRYALKRLETAGLITRTRGRGTFLRETGVERIVDQPSPVTGNGNFPGRRVRRPATIGVVFSYASEIDVMQTAILRGIEHAVKSRGYGLLLGRADDYDEAGELKTISELIQHGVSGMVVLPVSNRPATSGVRMLIERGVPVVLVDRYLADLDTGYVVSDNATGMCRATEHLILLGHTSFEFVVGLAAGTAAEQLMTTSVRDRYYGYCQALRDYNLAGTIYGPRAVELTDADAVCQLLHNARSRSDRPPAIVAVHDYVAVELMKTAARIGLKPPLDFAIVGFDDLPIASHLSTPLTTVVQPRYDIGYRAGHLLLDKIAGCSIRGDKLSLLVSLVVRESCGAHRVASRHPAAADPAPAPA